MPWGGKTSSNGDQKGSAASIRRRLGERALRGTRARALFQLLHLTNDLSLCQVLLLLRVELQEFEAVVIGAFDRVQDVRRHAQHLACGKRHARIGQHHACRALHQVVQRIAEVLLFADAFTRSERQQRQVEPGVACERHTGYLTWANINELRQRLRGLRRQIPQRHETASFRFEPYEGYEAFRNSQEWPLLDSFSRS